MSFERTFNNTFLRMIVCVTMAILIVAGPSSADARHEPGPSVCDRAVVIDLDRTLRMQGLPLGEDLFLRVEVPGPGYVSLDVAVPGISTAEPVLVPVSAICGGFPAARPVVLERTIASLVLSIDSPGDYVFRLTSSDPTKPLSEIKVSAGHFPFGEDEDEIESEPDPFAQDGKPPGFGEDEDEIESEPDPFAGDNSKTALVNSVLAEICGHGERDDHGDTLGCATVVAPHAAVTGEIANDWGDDVDVFRFILAGAQTDLWRVEVATFGTTDTFGVLLNRHGERLSQTESGGSGDNFRLTRTLRPGVYFVRVEGSLRTEGSYRLKLDVSALSY